jgi:hypothetical protein
VRKQTIVFVVLVGLAFGSSWGSLSLILWSKDDRIPALILAPLWLTAEIATRLAIYPLLAGALACALVGLVPAAVALSVLGARRV